MEKRRIAVVPGSFDPVTRGHVDVVERAARLFDRVWVAAMVNRDKAYWFNPEERVDMLRHALAHLPNVQVEFSAQMLWQYCLEKGACAIVKGIRTGEDAAYELEMARYNAAHNPLAQTVLLPASAGLEQISSTQVRQLARQGDGRLADMIHPYTLKKIKAKL